jgi:GTP-dependent phosphoenolpyruvate carboxykinase
MPITRAYEEIIDFIADWMRPEDVVAFRPSPEAKDRVADLIHREKTTGLSAEETAELHHYLQLEHLMRLAKARARAHLAHE